MKKIFINAYSELNLGDDLFVKILCDRYPGIKFYILCPRKKSNGLKKIKNLKVIYTIPFIDSVLSKLKIPFNVNEYIKRSFLNYCSGMVYIGGSIFIQNKKWKQEAKRQKKIIKKHKPFFILGSNFGPYYSEEYFDTYNEIFGQMTEVTFREKYSYELFKNLKNVRYAPDIVFTLSLGKVNFVPISGKYIVISVLNVHNRDKLSKYADEYEKKISELCKEFIEEKYKVVLMSFCEKEGDEEAIVNICKYFSNEEKKLIESYKYDGDLEESLSILQNSKFIVATRFHAFILSLCFNIPVLPVIYSNKTYNVIKDLNFKNNYIWIKEIENFNTKETINFFNTYIPIDISEQRKKAFLHFRELDRLLL